MFSSWIRLFLVANILILLIALLAKGALNIQDQYVEFRSLSTAREVAENIRLQIESHVQVLQSVAEVEQANPNPSPSGIGNQLMEAIFRNYPGLYAVNWMDERGVIRRVFPYDQNKAALGKNLLEVASVADTILLSRDQEIPTMMPRVMTFQGIEGATLYIPVSQGGRQVGWVNGVLDIQGWLTESLKRKNEEGLSLRLDWTDDRGATYEFGPRSIPLSVNAVEMPILNQNLEIRVLLEEGPLMSHRRALGWMIVAIGAGLAVVFLLLMHGLYRSFQELTVANQRLSLKNALISSLTHDLSNPLTVMNLSMERLEEEKRLDEHVWRRLKKSSEVLRAMIDSVRFMHAVDTGRASLHLKDIVIQDCVNEALEQVRESLELKAVQIRNTMPSKPVSVLGDEITLVHNVLPNILTNAIKFSRPGGEIKLSLVAQGQEVHLCISDDGVGIPSETLKDFLDNGRLLSRQGTDGESGSGLGMLQVKTFMDLYRGRLEIESVEESDDESRKPGTTVKLVFRAVRSEEGDRA